MTDDIFGNSISISWDKIKGLDFIIIRDSYKDIIMMVQKMLWDGFTPEIRDKIIEHARKCYG